MSDDLLDMTPEKRAPAKRVKRTANAVKPIGAGRNGEGHDASIAQALLRPVTITFLSLALSLDRRTVVKRLANLPPVGNARGSTPLYDFKQALEYLVTPRVNIEDAIKRIGTDDLPVSLQKDVWEARLKAQTWRERAGELWRTDDVLEVLGEAFQRLKTTTQLWIDQIGDTHSLPAPARKELMALVDALQADLHRTLVEMPRERMTKSQEAEIEGTPLDG